MKKLTLLILINTLISLSLSAQETEEKKPSPWKLNGSASLNFVQSSFTNWSAGGNNSVAGTTSSNLKLLYSKEKINWETNLALAYGLTFLEGDRRKNDDKIDFASKFGYEAFKYWSYTGLVTFKSQFDKGYASYPVTENSKYNSKFMAPGYLTLSLGMDYKPNADFSVLISPISAKFTFVNDTLLSNQGAFGVNKGEKLVTAWGALISATYNKKLHENISLSTKLDLFSNLLDSPENVVVDWNAKIIFNITKYIKANIDMQLKYDDLIKIYDDTGAKVSGAKAQFKQVLGIGFSYVF